MSVCKLTTKRSDRCVAAIGLCIDEVFARPTNADRCTNPATRECVTPMAVIHEALIWSKILWCLSLDPSTTVMRCCSGEYQSHYPTSPRRRCSRCSCWDPADASDLVTNITTVKLEVVDARVT